MALNDFLQGVFISLHKQNSMMVLFPYSCFTVCVIFGNI